MAKCKECTFEGNYKTVDAWTEKFEDKHGVLAGYIGELVKVYKLECPSCKCIKLEIEHEKI